MKRVGSELAALMATQENRSAMMARTEAMNQADRDNTLLLLHRIASNDFGLQGKAFTITYGLVGSVRVYNSRPKFTYGILRYKNLVTLYHPLQVAGLVITYSIIIYQFQGN